MEKGITFLNKTISGFWWILLFICTLIFSFLTVGLYIHTHIGTHHTLRSLDIPLTILGGLIGIVTTLLGALLFAAILRGIGWLAHLALPYTIFLRITLIYILINMLFGLLPHALFQQLLSDVVSSLYLSVAIWATVSPEQRKPWVFIIGLLPAIFTILYTISIRV